MKYALALIALLGFISVPVSIVSAAWGAAWWWRLLITGAVISLLAILFAPSEWSESR